MLVVAFHRYTLKMMPPQNHQVKSGVVAKLQLYNCLDNYKELCYKDTDFTTEEGESDEEEGTMHMASINVNGMSPPLLKKKKFT